MPSPTEHDSSSLLEKSLGMAYLFKIKLDLHFIHYLQIKVTVSNETYPADYPTKCWQGVGHVLRWCLP